MTININGTWKQDAEILEVKDLLSKLLIASQEGDLKTYQSLICEDLTCFEPETSGYLLAGTNLHEFYVKHTKQSETYHIELIDTVIKVEGNMAFASYTKLFTEITGDTDSHGITNETRIFRTIGSEWKMVHFHRSSPTM
jgi:ketosteroid isomerase-like protein